MSRALTNIEFFAYEQEVWLREADGSMRSLRETDYDFIDKMAEHISTFYPKAYAVKNNREVRRILIVKCAIS